MGAPGGRGVLPTLVAYTEDCDPGYTLQRSSPAFHALEPSHIQNRHFSVRRCAGRQVSLTQWMPL